jgi:hypothetical protein
MIIVRLLLLLGVFVLPGFTQAQDTVLEGHQITSPPTIDGVINEAEWQGVPGGKGMVDEGTGQPAPEDTQFWIGYDDKFIYFAARVLDSQPSSIRATEYRTNVSLSGDDSIELLLDLSGSLADFNGFAMNARGATQIGLAGGRAAKREWSGEFVSQGRITETGWEVEARIPWRIMRLPAAGPRTIRFNVERELRRTERTYVWRYTGAGNQANFGRWTGVVLPKAPVERVLRLLPYGYVGADDDGHIVNAGLDLKTNLADQVVLVGSVNPDFRNIENAILSLDFSRFERLAGETRPFFQEGSQYLNSALFASQRIRSFDVGANVHGRLNDKMSFGLLDTIDFDVQNSFMGNFTFDPNPNESYRVTATNMARDGLENTAHLLRYQRVMGPFALFLRNMGTKDTVLGDGVYNTAGLFYENKGVAGYLEYDAASSNFVPRLGFTPERDFRGLIFGAKWERVFKTGPIRQSEIGFDTVEYERYDGGFYRRQGTFWGTARLPSGTSLTGWVDMQNFLGTVDRTYNLGFRHPGGNPYRNFFANRAWGRVEDEDYVSQTVGFAYRPVEKLQLTASYQHVEHFDKSDLGILGFNYDMGRDMYVSGRVVKRNEDWNAYMSFRRSGNRGAEYYLILGDPNARTFRTSLIMKVVWPFQL